MIIGCVFMKLSQQLGKQLSKKIFGDKFKDSARKRPEDFTRKRGMSFEELILYMLTSLKCSTASSLRRFFTSIGTSLCIAQQSFSEARQKVKVDAFIDLFETTVTPMLEHGTNTWHGYRVLAIDGSKIPLPADKKLLAHYGALGKDKTAPTAQASIVYDVLNDTIVDASIEPMTTDERTLAIKHLNAYIKLAPNGKKLVIFDRGYPSFELIELLESMGFTYVMRVKSKFNKDIDAQTKSDGYIWLKQGDNRIHVRVIKFMLDSGEEETLITNITDKRLGKNVFKKLYFMRWPIETKYDEIKNKLQVENFSGLTIKAVMQDFYIIMLLSNAIAVAGWKAQSDIDEQRKDKDNKYNYHVNVNHAIGVFRNRFIRAMLEEKPRKRAKEVKRILYLLAKNPAPTRPNRSIPRNKSPRKAKFRHNRKSSC